MASYAMAIENSPEANNNYLTVRQSLIPMFARGGFSETYVDEEFPLNRINPKAKEYLRFYLEQDNNSQMHIYGAIWLLGFIGDEDDILFLDQYIDKTLRSFTNTALNDRLRHLRNMGGIAGCFTGMMIKRNIKGAELFFKKYANVSSWKVPNEEETLENLHASRGFYSNFIMASYQYSKADYIYLLLQEKSPDPRRPYTHELFTDSLKKIEVDKYTKLMKPNTLPDEKLNKNITKCLENYGQWIDMLLKKQTSAQWRQAHLEKQKTVSKKEKRTIDSFENIDMSRTVEGRYLKAIGSEATNAYVMVSNMLLDRNDKNLPIKKEILQDIKKAKLNNYDDFRVRIEVEAKINDFVPANMGVGSKGTVVKEKETAGVIFNIRDTADIFKKHVPDAGDSSLTSSTTGDVKINMKRSNRKWNWNTTSDSNVIFAADVVEDSYLIDSANEAMTAYTQIAGMLIAGNYDPMEIPVLDNGKLIPLEKRQRTRDEIVKALDFEKRILQDILKGKLDNYGDFKVKLEFEATLDNFVPAVNGVRGNEGIGTGIGTEPVEVKGYETATGTFVIRDAAKIYKKYASRKSGSDSIDRAGNLHVYMKRINGKWYWNPFGW
jgi:hypothetical protein